MNNSPNATFREFNSTEVRLSGSSLFSGIESSPIKLSEPLEEISSAEAQDLRQQADRLQNLLKVMPAGVVVVDGKGQVKQANQVALDFLGEPLEGEAWRTIIQRSFKPQADDGHEVSLRDGRKVKLSITPLANEPGQIIVLTDLTETRELQQRMSHLQRLSSLGNMVASLAHQIRTPLSAAMLYGANLNNQQLPEQSRQQFTDKLMSRLQDLESQVNDMLLFAKSGDHEVVSDLSLQTLLTEVETGSEAMLKKHNARLEVTLPEPDVLILGNKTALAGALQNLIQNSIQVKPEGAVIKLSAIRQNDNNNIVAMTVTDNGPGIERETAKRIFEPFYTTKSQGTGLGLAVVKAVAQSHHGKVSMHSEVGAGTSISLCLPTLNQDLGEQLNPDNEYNQPIAVGA
jgi:two-component system sensor histidine kinase FlrB